MPKVLEFIRREKVILLRYLFVGGSSFAVKAACYAALSRAFWIGGPHSIQNIIAIIVATIYNYILHRYWTFNHQAPAPGTISRYVAIVVAGNSLDALMFYVAHDLIGLYDFGVLIGNTALIAGLSFLAHRMFTFHNDPWKKGQSVSSE